MQSFLNREIHTFRRGIVTELRGGYGICRELMYRHSTSPTRGSVDISFGVDDFRLLDVDTHGRRLYFKQRQSLLDGIPLVPFRPPIVDDIIVFTTRWTEDGLIAPMWTYEDYFDLCEDKLPRCIAKECNSVPVYGKYYCTYHAPREQHLDEPDDYVSTTEVYNRAYAHFGNAEQAREAAEMYPGDFI